MDQKHKVHVSITECTKMQYNTGPNLQTLKFEVKFKLFCLCVLKQMEKIRELMNENSFKEHREGDFPYSIYKDFQSAYEKSKK